MEYIDFNNLSTDEKEPYVRKAAWLLLYKYIDRFNKLCKAGLDPFEYFELRGLPLNYTEVEDKLINQELVIKIGKDNSFDIVDRKEL